MLEQVGTDAYSLAEEVPLYNWKPVRNRVDGWLGWVGVSKIVQWEPKQTAIMAGWQLHQSLSSYSVYTQTHGWQGDVIRDDYGAMSTIYLLSDGSIYSASMRGFDMQYLRTPNVKTNDVARFVGHDPYRNHIGLYVDDPDAPNPGANITVETLADIGGWSLDKVAVVYNGLARLYNNAAALIGQASSPSQMQP